MENQNQELAKIFWEIAERLKMDSIPFKPHAYEKAALFLEEMKENISSVYEKEGLSGLEKMPFIGKSIAEKIEEFLKTGKIKYYEKLKMKIPVDLNEIESVGGMGPKKAKTLYQELGIRNLNELEKAAKAKKISPLPGFGEKTEKNILEGIAFLKKEKGRFLIGEITPVAEYFLEKLRELKEAEKISLAGSLRRKKETIGDCDVLVVSENQKKVMDYFVSLPEVKKILAKGLTKSSIRTEQGLEVDLRVVPKKSYGAALQYFTGSKEHNIIVRKMAMEKGLKLNEYGIFKGERFLGGETEEEVYSILGLPFILPELREGSGEVEAAILGKLPNLVELKDMKGDLHCHSDWDGGENSIEEMAMAAMDLGYEYIGISDHTKFLRIENGLDEEKLMGQKNIINQLNSKFQVSSSMFHVLHGCETNILADGSVDISDDVLSQLDYVIAGTHSSLKMEKEEMTKRIIKTMENPNVDIISHPTGRLLKKRDECQIDFPRILEAAKKTGTILEINASPLRLDLKDLYIRQAKAAGVKMIINTDAHEKSQLGFMEHGVNQARRGWAEKGDIINTLSKEDLILNF